MLDIKDFLRVGLLSLPFYILLGLGFYFQQTILVLIAYIYVIISICIFLIYLSKYTLPKESCYTCIHALKFKQDHALCDVIEKYVHPLSPCKFYKSREVKWFE